jgi:hypothetical protein
MEVDSKLAFCMSSILAKIFEQQIIWCDCEVLIMVNIPGGSTGVLTNTQVASCKGSS